MDNLPIGTMVSVKGILYMIVGYMPVYQGKKYDYSTCLFPAGLVSDQIYMLNNDEIDKIVFIGYQNDNTLKLFETLDKLKNSEQTDIYNMGE